MLERLPEGILKNVQCYYSILFLSYICFARIVTSQGILSEKSRFIFIGKLNYCLSSSVHFT